MKACASMFEKGATLDRRALNLAMKGRGKVGGRKVEGGLGGERRV